MNLLKSTGALGLICLVLTSYSCKKTDNAADGGSGGNGSSSNAPSAQNPHQMNDPRIVGEWKNVSVSDFSWQTAYGVNAGAQNGSYLDYKINADGSGTCVKYVTTTEQGSTYSIFQRTSGFFKAEKNGSPEGYYAFTYCPTSGVIEITKNGSTTKRNLAGNELYRENDAHSARDFFPSYNIVQPSSGSYTDPHHYLYYTYTDQDGNLVTLPGGNAKVTSMVDVL